MRVPVLKRSLFLATALAVASVFAGAAGAHTSAPAAAVPPIAWVLSPPSGTTLLGGVNRPTTFTVRAVDKVRTAKIHIAAATPLPAGAALGVRDGNPAVATFSWTATVAGDYTVTLSATDDLPIPVSAPAYTINIHVQAGPETVQLSGGPDNVSRWAYVRKPAVVRAGPSTKAKIVGRLGVWTPENFPNLALALQQVVDVSNGTWVQVRLAKLPNNSTGWVKRGFLGPFHSVTTHLIVDRTALRATLYKDGLPVFQTIIGVGRSYWPTPRGEFYIREKITGFRDPMYGPIAFGTSARSAVLTDWPGGGFIGIHGTNQPSILPGRVSHGCIRMRNPSILNLARMLPVGTPLTVK